MISWKLGYLGTLYNLMEAMIKLLIGAYFLELYAK